MNDLFNGLKGLFAPTMQVTQLAAIWLEKAIQTGETKTMRIAPGDKVLIKGNEIADVVDKPSHVILKCFGKPTSDFSIEVSDLETGDITIVNL